MRAKHKRWHVRMWLVLGPLVGVLAVAGVLLRPRPPVQSPEATEPVEPLEARP